MRALDIPTICEHIKLAYASERIPDDLKLQNQDWQILCNSASHPESNKYGFKAIALINHKSKELSIAIAGTNITNIYDLKDDISLACGFLTDKIKPMTEFFKITATKLPNIEEYSIQTSGHSLGAIHADLLYTYLELYKDVHKYKLSQSITLDNPGSKNILIKALKIGALEIKIDEAEKFIKEKLSDHFHTYNAEPNFINKAFEQCANHQHIPEAEDKAESIKCSQNHDHNILCQFEAVIVNMTQIIWKKLTYIPNTLETHKLEHIESAFKKEYAADEFAYTESENLYNKHYNYELKTLG